MSALDGTTIDTAEVERFSRLAQEWWNPVGKFKPLHKFNPVRLEYIREQLAMNFDLDLVRRQALRRPVGARHRLRRRADLRADGPPRREGRRRRRLGDQYRGRQAPRGRKRTCHRLPRHHRRGDRSEGGETFDVVLALEIVEHVSDVDLFLTSCAAMVKPGGLLFVATINRTFKALTFAIIGAEYVLGWLPKGTHQYERLVRPKEIGEPVGAGGPVDDRRGRRGLSSAGRRLEAVARHRRQLHGARAPTGINRGASRGRRAAERAVWALPPLCLCRPDHACRAGSDEIDVRCD